MAGNFITSYLLKNNLQGNTVMGTGNLLPAAMTTLTNLLGNVGNKTTYELYKEQAKSYVDTARENVKILDEQEAIELRNLRYKNKILRGQDMVSVGAKGGNMTGSNLDIMIQKEKVRLMEEATVQGNYANKRLAEMHNGLTNAANTYGSMRARAGMDKWNIWGSIMKGLEVYVDQSVKDAVTIASNNAKDRNMRTEIGFQMASYNALYGSDYTDKVKQVVLNDTEDKYGDLAGILGTGNTAATSLNNVQFK